jgi:protein arginine kinase activator
VLCEMCQKNEAEVTVKQMVDQEERELLLCQDCAQKTAGKLATSLMEMILDATFEIGNRRFAAAEATCPGCGLTRPEFRKRSRLGCERCYEAFGRDIEPMVRDMHRGDRHVGKTPVSERLAHRLSELETALRAAVKAQRFEEAAVLRDQIRELKTTGDAPAAKGGARAAQ